MRKALPSRRVRAGPRTPSQAHGQQAWAKLRRNPMFWAGGSWLAVVVSCSMLGYALAPDSTPFANHQVLEWAKLPPGATRPELRLPTPGGVFVLEHLWQGTPAPGLRLPLCDTCAGAGGRFGPWAVCCQAGTLHYAQPSGMRETLALSSREDGSGQNACDRLEVRTTTFWLGTDAYGRDILSRLLLGGRVSLAVGLFAMLLSLTLGVGVGATAGYFGGRWDAAAQWLMAVVWSVPTLLLAIAIAYALGRGLGTLALAIGLTTWVELARVVRGQALALRNREFVQAGRALGFPSGRILARLVLPNLVGPILILAVANFGSAVLLEAGLSFLGLGVPSPTPTWGAMVFEGYQYLMLEGGKWLALFPGLAIVLLVLALNLLGMALRDALDPGADA